MVSHSVWKPLNELEPIDPMEPFTGGQELKHAAIALDTAVEHSARINDQSIGATTGTATGVPAGEPEQ